MNASHPIKVVIVEDEFIIADDLRLILEDLGYHVSGVETNAKSAIETVEREMPDIVLLDINIKGDVDGIDLAHKIKSQYQIPHVFITSHSDPETLDRAKETRPYGFLVKPFEEREIRAILEIALYNYQDDLEKAPDFVLNKSIFVRVIDRMVRVSFEDLQYLSADGNYTKVHTKDKNFTVRAAIKELEIKLPKTQFARLHKSYLINLASITAINSEIVTVGKMELPISRSQYSWLIKKINLF